MWRRGIYVQNVLLKFKLFLRNQQKTRRLLYSAVYTVARDWGTTADIVDVATVSLFDYQHWKLYIDIISYLLYHFVLRQHEPQSINVVNWSKKLKYMHVRANSI